MEWELDHVFLATDEPEVCEAALASAGFDFVNRSVHRGQGTANACAFFNNVYFEILLEDDLDALRSDVVRPLCLEDRIHWRKSGACPFGVCFRPGKGKSLDRWPTETWLYERQGLPPEASLRIVTPRDSPDEPMIFLSGTSTPAWSGKRAGILTGVKLGITRTDKLSPSVHGCPEQLLRIFGRDEYSMELEWSDGAADETVEFGAEVPILLRNWRDN